LKPARIFLVVAAGTAFWTLSLPLYIDFLLTIVLLVFGFKLPPKEFGLVAISAIVGIALLAPLSRLLIETGTASVFYREHEQYARPGQTYAPNVDAVINQPHGDNLAIDPLAPSELREPRVVHFRTDNLGYRNASGYHGQVNVLVGDSFIVGNGMDEKDTLAAQLASKFGVDTYTMAFPGAPLDYERRAAWFLSAKNFKARFSFFIYEGNNFENSFQRSVAIDARFLLPPDIASILDQYDRIREVVLRPLSPWLAYRPFVGNAGKRIEKMFLQRTPSQISTFKIGARLMGFLEDQNAATVDPHPGLAIDLNVDVIRQTACIFFVPSKLRVYGDWLPSSVADRIVVPPPAYELLARTYAPLGLNVIDLTPLLKEAARTELKSGNYVYWRDDTHWNGRGVASVAATVDECIRTRRASDSYSNTKVPEWEYAFDGLHLSIGTTEVAIRAIESGGIEGAAQSNQSYLIEGWAASNDGQRGPKRVLAFVGNRLVASVPPRISTRSTGTMRGPDGRGSRFQLAIPRNFIEESRAPVRIFAVFDEREAAELTMGKEITAILLR
jgi:hypothetical protein